MFKVSYDGQEIGSQTFVLSPYDNGYKMTIEASFSVDIFFVNVYEYTHNNVEIWEDGCLVSLDAYTNANGKESSVHLFTIGDISYVKSGQEETSIFGCAKPFAYWDSSFLEERALVNSQTGVLEPITSTLLGQEMIKYAEKNILSNHFLVKTPTFSIELWYAVEDGEWLSLQNTTAEGKVLKYERI